MRHPRSALVVRYLGVCKNSEEMEKFGYHRQERVKIEKEIIGTGTIGKQEIELLCICPMLFSFMHCIPISFSVR